MSLKTECPLPTAIGDITTQDCQEHFGQIVRYFFQRVGTPFVDITDEAEWDIALAAADDTKIQGSPFAEGITFPTADPITEGGDDNTTQFGQIIVVGGPTVVVAGNHRGLPSDIQKELQEYISESAVYNQLGVYLVNEFGDVISNTTNNPFPINSYFIGDATSEGYNTHNKTFFQWSMRYGWSENFEINELTWDILSK